MLPVRRFVALILLAVLAGCDVAAPAAPEAGVPLRAEVRERAPDFVHRAPSAPPFKEEVVSLQIHPGEAGRAELTFADGSPFAAFELPSGALVGARLRGAPLAPDEAVTITLRRVDASRFYVKLEPSGLVFNPEAPPAIVFDLTHAHLRPDDVEALQVWKQDHVGERWTRMPAAVDPVRRRVRGRVDDFSGYTLSTGSRSDVAPGR